MTRRICLEISCVAVIVTGALTVASGAAIASTAKTCVALLSGAECAGKVCCADLNACYTGSVICNCKDFPSLCIKTA